MQVQKFKFIPRVYLIQTADGPRKAKCVSEIDGVLPAIVFA